MLMKNIVNRALVAKKKQFLSKSVPRGTRTIWRYLGALFLIFTLSIGQMWGADPTIGSGELPSSTLDISSVSTTRGTGKVISSGSTTSGNPYYVMAIDSIRQNYKSKATDIPWVYCKATDGGGSHTLSLADGLSDADKLGFLTTVASAAGINSGRYHNYRIKNCTSVTVLNRSNNTKDEKRIWLNIFKYNSLTESFEYQEQIKSAYNSSKDIVVSATLSADDEYVIQITSGATSNSKCSQIRFTGVAATSYTVTLNPNEGGYATTPTGWTVSAGNYTKTVSAGALTIPAPARDGYDFNGWKSGETAVTLTDGKLTVAKDTTLVAQWVAETTKYDVTYSAGAGSGTVPASAKYAEGAKFNLPGQGEMVAPSGKAFDGWKANGTGDKLAANAEYTMGNDAVEFVAQWKAVPTTLYSLTVTKTSQVNLNNGGAQDDLSDDATIVGGGAYMQNDHASSAQQILGSTKLQFKAGTITLVMTLNNALKEGDTIKATGLNSEGLCFGVTFDRAGSLDNQLASDASYFIVPEGFEGKTTLYAWRHSGSGTTCASIIIRRPAERLISSTTITLSDVKVNNRSISSDSLTTLVSAKSLLLKDEYAVAPVIKFNEHKVITYSDGESPATKTTDKVYTVTATTVEGKWQASQTINEVAYTVTATKVSSAKVYYYDGSTKLGEETVAINGNPAEYADYQSKDLSSFVGWYDNSGLTGDAVTIASATITKDTTFYGKWNPVYATSINIEQWTLTNGAGIGATTKTSALISAIGSHNFAHNLEWVNKNLELDSLNDDPGKTNRNYAYLGLKIKASGKMLDFRLANGQTVKVKLGATGNYPQVALNGGSYADMSLTDNVWTYTADGADAYISIKTANNNTVVIKQVMINEDLQTVTLPWRVTYDANGGTCATAEAIWSGSALILPDVTPADADHTFAGWYDEVSGGELQGVAGASYTPTDNETLFAHFAPVEYAVNYAAGDHGSGDMVAANVGWGTVYTAVANGFTPETGYIFAGWAVTGVDGVSTIPALGSFTMPKNEVTLTALWEDNSKVAVIVETNVKYESLADAITAAEAGQTIQLLQNIEQADGVAIAKNLILDLNGKTYTCTSGSNVNSRAIKITAGNVTIQNGSIIAVPTANFEGGCYGPIRIEGASTNVTLEDLTLRNGRHYGLGIKLVEGYLRMEDCTVISENGGGGLEVAGTADVINCTFTQTGLDNAHAWISTCLATCDNGVLNVQGGTYTSEHYSMYVYTSGGEMDVESGSFTGDVVNKVTLSSYPDAVGTVNISGGSFEGAGGNPIQFTTDNSGATSIAISGGTFDAPVENEYCAPGYVPSAEVAPGVYTVVPKDGVEIIGVVVTGNTTGTVSGLYKGDAAVNLNSKKLDSGKYIYVTLKEGYTFEENDVLIVDVNAKASIGTKALEITTGVGNIDGAVWKTIAFEDYATGDNIISLEGIAANQTSIGLKRSDNQNAKINGIRVLRPMKPMLTAITIDGRDGVINEAAKTVAVTIPYEANLAALTVVPTIVWNEAAASNSIVVNDGSAWIEGANTYKLTDKDGDYTVYTITLTRDVLKHTVSFNTHGGSAVASEEVVHGEYLAAAPADPTKEDYIFQYWSEDEDGAEVDVTTVQINADKEFHAVWASDGAIKLLDGSTVNHTNFITGVTADETVVFQGNEVHYAKFSGTVSGVNGVKDLTRVIAYNATTNKTKIQISAHNNSTSGRNILVKGLVEGADAAVDLATIALGNKEDKVSDWIEFNNAANRTIYIMVSSSAGDVYFTQVKVIESGETPMKQAGEAGYSLNLNKGRFFGLASTDLAFEGLNARLSGDYTALNSGYAKLTSTSMSFTVASAMTLSVTTNNNKTYYVTKGAAGTDNETAKTGVSEFDLTAGTWYITAGNSEVQFTNIAFALPKCEEPTISAQPASKQTFDPGNLTATVVATVSDGGTLKYQWYNASNDEEVEGATSATLTTTTEGTYYVIVTNTLADHSDNSVKSEEATLGYRVQDDATLSALSASAGTLDPTFDKAVEEYRVDLPEGTVDVPTLSATATMAGYANVAINNATAFVNYEATSTVVVTSEDGTANKTYTVKFYVDHLIPELVPVTESTTWNWTGSVQATINDVENKGLILANYIDGLNFEMIEGKADEYARRTQNGGVYQGTRLHFKTTVPGKVKFYFRAPSDGENCTITVKNNGKEMVAGTRSNSLGWSKEIVVKGDVEIEMVNDKQGGGTTRVQQIVFTELTPDYTRNVTSNFGTLCVEKNVVVGGALGATFYQIASRNEDYDYKIDFEEVLPNEELKAGEPYLFKSNTGKIELFFGETEAPEPVAVRGMIGNYDATTLEITEENKNTIYYFAQNKLWLCDNLVGGYLTLNDHRAYIDLTQVPTYEAYNALQQQNPAPRRRVSLEMNGEKIATGCENLNVSDKPLKMIINGQLFILRGEKMYDAKGQLVK